MKTIIRALFVASATSTLLGGCAVYGPPAFYGGAPYPSYQPAPVHVAPPVSLGFNFGYWGGGGWGYRHH